MIVSSLVVTVLMPLARDLGGIPVGSAVIGFLAVWFGKSIFSWFTLRPTILMVIIIGIGFLLISLNRLRATTQERFPLELLFAIGELVGVIIGGIYFL